MDSYVTTSPLMTANLKRIVRLCVKEPVTVGVQRQRICRCRWAHVLRRGPRGRLPPLRDLC